MVGKKVALNLAQSKYIPAGTILRLLRTFAGVLQKKKVRNLRTCALFNEAPISYKSVQRLQNVEFDEIMFCFDFCFSKVAEAVRSRQLQNDRLTFQRINSVCRFREFT